MKNMRKGFTLVELLAVIVILAIIMIIAIPSVLGTMTTARQKSFCEYVTKVYMAAQNKYMAAQTLGTGDIGSSFTAVIEGTSIYYYNIKTDLGLENVGDYKGYVGIIKPTTDHPKPYFIIVLSDSNYALVTGDYPYYIYDKEPTTENLIDVDENYTTILNAFENAIDLDNKTVDMSKIPYPLF